jgi:hypothetical protein
VSTQYYNHYLGRGRRGNRLLQRRSFFFYSFLVDSVQRLGRSRCTSLATAHCAATARCLLGIGRGGKARVARAAVGERGRRGDGRWPARIIIIIIIIIAMRAPAAKSRQMLTHIIYYSMYIYI